MRAGAGKTNANAGLYTKFINSQIKTLDAAEFEFLQVLGGTTPDFIKKAGLGPAKKKVEKMVDDFVKLEKMLKDNKYYEK